MASVETHYLVDFENVHEDGLSGSETLGSKDHIHLFSTTNAQKINIEILASFNSTNLSAHMIPAGSQSLDMHLVSYLGYLIGKNTDKTCDYVIISKDTDYDNVIAFWKSHNIPDITRHDKISSAVKKKASQKKATVTKTNSTAGKDGTSENTIRDTLSRAGLASDVINYVVSVVSSHHNEKNAKHTIYIAIVSKYGQDRGLKIYSHIKKIL